MVYAIGIGKVLRKNLVLENGLNIDAMRLLKYPQNRKFEIKLYN
jgi:hypothetical protein